jgi:multidrug resistance protein, MATE family
VLSTAQIGRLTGVAEPVLRGLGALPLLLALAVVAQSVGAAASSTLVTLGRGRTVMRAGLISTAVTVALSGSLVLGPGPLPALGVTGAGAAMLVSNIVYTAQT